MRMMEVSNLHLLALGLGDNIGIVVISIHTGIKYAIATV